jgi:transmembrane sensor
MSDSAPKKKDNQVILPTHGQDDLLARYRDAVRDEPIDVDRKKATWQAIAQTMEAARLSDVYPSTPPTPRPQPAAAPRLRWFRGHDRAQGRGFMAFAVVLLTVVVSWLVLRPASLLDVRTGPQSAVVTLADGSSVTLRAHSHLTQSGPHTYTLQGEAYFDIVPDPSRVVSIDLPGARVEVLGTAFTIQAWSAAPSVFLERGKIRLVGTRDSLQLAPGEGAIVDPSSGRLALQDGLQASLSDWRANALFFDETPLRDVVAELAHHFDISIEMDYRLAEESLSGHLPLRSRNQTLEDVALLLNGRFEFRAERTYVLTRN